MAVHEIAFTTFESPQPANPTLSINRNGTFYLNAAASDLLGSPDALVMLADQSPDGHVSGIGFAASKKGEQGYRPVRPRNGAITISGQAFLSRHGIPLPDTRQRFYLRPVKQEGKTVLYARLNEPVD